MPQTMATPWILCIFVFILPMGRVSCVTHSVGEEAVPRQLTDPPGSNVIIPNPFAIVQEDGLVTKWRSYMTDTDGCVRLQAWRPNPFVALGTTPHMVVASGNPIPTTGRPFAPRTYWTLLGETDCIISERSNDSTLQIIPGKERIRVEKNDVIGFGYETTNPIPYDIHSPCTELQKTKQLVSPDFSKRTMDPGELYGFTSLPECRAYSFNATILKDSCTRLEATENIHNLTYFSTDRYDDKCWIIQAMFNRRLRSRVTYISVDELGLPDGRCSQGHLEIREGLTSTSQYVRRECDTPLNMDIRPITTGQVYIRFKRFGDLDRNVRLAIRYSTSRGLMGQACANVMVTPTPSYIQSPNFPAHYPANSDFCWKLLVPLGKDRIRIEVSTGLDLQPPVGCHRRQQYNTCTYRNCLDYIEIRDGDDPHSPMLTTWCDHTGSDLVETSSGRSLYITFVSDGAVQGTGFRMKIYAVHPETALCTHRTALETSNTIHSHFYPYNYPDNRDDCWSIRTLEGKDRIILTTHDSVLELDSTCTKDWVEVRDGPGRDAPLLRRWCGSTLPPQIISSGPALYIRFVSNARYESAGFYLEYKQTNTEACTTYYAYSYTQSVALTSDVTGSGISIKCVMIRSDADRVKLKWDDVTDTADMAICGNNYIEVSDGDSPASKELGRYCNSLPIPSQGISSTGNVLFIRWVSDPSTKHNTVKLSYSSLSTGHCSKFLTTATRPGIIATPPLYGTTTFRPFVGRAVSPASVNNKTRPDPIEPCPACVYEANADNCWMVETKRGIGKLRFEIKFLELQDSDSSGTCRDYIEIFDGKTEGFQSFGRKCGRQLPFNITTTGPFALMKFLTDGTIQKRGYRILTYAVYEDECHKLESRPYNYDLQSPDFPSSFPINIQQCWLIESPSPRNPVYIKAAMIELGDDDSLEIYDGINVDALLLKVWDHNTPSESDVTSVGQTVTIILRSGPLSTGMSRFNLQYKWIYSERCDYVSLGDDKNDGIAYITTPGYDTSNYKSNDYACWVITTVLPHNQIRVYSEDFELEDVPKCVHDFMEIFDGPTGDDPFLRKWCGKFEPGIMTHSTGRTLYIRFNADGANNYRGFKLKLVTYNIKTTEQTTSDEKNPSLIKGLHLTNRDLALIVVVLIVLLVIILVIVIAVKCKRKNNNNYPNQNMPVHTPTIVYTSQPPAYPGSNGAVGGIVIDERKDPLPSDTPPPTPPPDSDTNVNRQSGTEPTAEQRDNRDNVNLIE